MHNHSPEHKLITLVLNVKCQHKFWFAGLNQMLKMEAEKPNSSYVKWRKLNRRKLQHISDDIIFINDQLSWKNSVKSINIFITFIFTTLAVEEFSLTWMDSLKFCANRKATFVFVHTFIHITSKDTKKHTWTWNELFTCGMSRSFYILPIFRI